MQVVKFFVNNNKYCKGITLNVVHLCGMLFSLISIVVMLPYISSTFITLVERRSLSTNE
jgi:hypothetical protein